MLGQSYLDFIRHYIVDETLDPNDVAAWYNKGVALDALGKTTEAKAAFTEAKKLGYSG
jgi:Flp pilus assembly protein TadD